MANNGWEVANQYEIKSISGTKIEKKGCKALATFSLHLKTYPNGDKKADLIVSLMGKNKSFWWGFPEIEESEEDEEKDMMDRIKDLFTDEEDIGDGVIKSKDIKDDKSFEKLKEDIIKSENDNEKIINLIDKFVEKNKIKRLSEFQKFDWS